MSRFPLYQIIRHSKKYPGDNYAIGMIEHHVGRHHIRFTFNSETPVDDNNMQSIGNMFDRIKVRMYENFYINSTIKASFKRSVLRGFCK